MGIVQLGYERLVDKHWICSTGLFFIVFLRKKSEVIVCVRTNTKQVGFRVYLTIAAFFSVTDVHEYAETLGDPLTGIV